MRLLLVCLGLLLALLHSAGAQVCNRRPPVTPSKDFPNIFEEGYLSSLLLTYEEVNKDNSTTYVEEAYDFSRTIYVANLLHGSALPSSLKGVTEILYANFDTDETFRIVPRDFSCKTNPYNFTLPVLPEKTPFLNRTSQFLIKGGLNSSSINISQPTYAGPSAAPIRGINAECWEVCYSRPDNTSGKATVCFSSEGWKNPNGGKSRIPLKVTVEQQKPKSLNQTTNFFTFNPVASGSLFKFPIGYGCIRTGDDDSEGMFNIQGQDFLLQAEVVFERNNNPKFFTTLEIAYSVKKETQSFAFTKWKREGKKTTTQYPMRIVYNMATGAAYKINREDGTCDPSHIAKQPRLNLPDGTELVFDNPELLFDNSGFYEAYTARDERGFETVVYEKEVDDFYMGEMNGIPMRRPNASVTRYYLMEGTKEVRDKSIKSPPTKIELRLFNNLKKVDTTITINIFTLITILPTPYPGFDVEPCFPDEDDYQWFQIKYIVPSQQRDKIYNQLGDAAETVRGMILLETDTSPTRLGKFLVDFDCTGLQITGKMINRDIFTGFNITQKKKYPIDDAGVSKMSKFECAKVCVTDTTCKAFAECGDECFIYEERVQKPVNDDGCTLYERKKKEDPPTWKLLEAIKNLLTDPFRKLVLRPYKDKEQPIYLVPGEFTDSIDHEENLFPNIFEFIEGQNGYQMTAEVNILDQAADKTKVQETLFFQEYYDIYSKKGRLEESKEGNIKSKVYFFDTNELFDPTRKTGQCATRDLNTSDVSSSDFLKHWNDYESDAVVFGPSAVLRKAYLSYISPSKSGYTSYVGVAPEKVRGKKAKCWVQCPIERNLTFTYYFTTVDTGNVPLRVVVNGTDKDSLASNVSQTYEYFNFNPSVDPRAIRVPIGSGCDRGPEAADDIHDLPIYNNTDYLMLGEVVYSDQVIADKEGDIKNYFSNFILAYHKTSQTYSLTYTLWTNKKKEVTNRSIRIVYLERSNVLYDIDRVTRECNMTVSDMGFDIAMRLPDNNILPMVDKNVLDSSGYKEMDFYRERDLPVIAFEKAVDNMTWGDDTYQRVVFTRYVLRDSEYYSQSARDENAPVRTRIRIYNNNELQKVISVNYYVFKLDIDQKSPFFNLEECFLDEKDYSFLQVKYNVENLETLDAAMQNSLELSKEFINDLILHTGISPTRLPYARIEADSSGLYVIAKVLERPPFLVDFDKTNKTVIKSEYKEYLLFTASECAKKCLESGADCRGFSICRTTCRIAANITNNIEDKQDCESYKLKGSTAQTKKEFLDDVALRVKVYLEPALLIPSQNNSKPPTALRPSEVIFSEVDPFKKKIIDDPIKSGFTLIKVSQKLKVGGKTKLIGNLGLSQCLTLCLNDPDCTSFSICSKGQSSCTLSSLEPSKIDTDSVEKSSACQIYGKTYLSRYLPFPGVTQTWQPKEEDVKSKTPESCASHCTNEKDFDCLSFDFCANDKSEFSCFLHDKHAMDSGSGAAGNTLLNCTHYSRKYIFDYKLENSHKWAKGLGKRREGVNLEQCARSCTEGVGVACQNFDFCAEEQGAYGECYLIDEDESDFELGEKSACDHYAAKDYVPRKKLISNGVAGGLAFLFIVIGIAIGALAVFGYGYYKANKR